MCHQSVGLISRIVEEGGICTTSVTSARDITEAVKPPRAAFVDFPLGHQTGRPSERDLQMKIIKGALELLKTATEPATIVDLPLEWPEGSSWKEKAFATDS